MLIQDVIYLISNFNQFGSEIAANLVKYKLRSSDPRFTSLGLSFEKSFLSESMALIRTGSFAKFGYCVDTIYRLTNIISQCIFRDNY